MRTFWIMLLSCVVILDLSAFSQSKSEPAQQVINLSASGYEIANSISYSPNGEELAVGTSSGILIFDTKQYLQKQFIPTQAWVRDLEFSPNGQWLAAGGFDHSAAMWNRSDWSPILTFKGHIGWVRSLAFSPDAKVLATCADDDTIRVWNLLDGSQKYSIGNLQGVRVLAISPDGGTLAIGLQDARIVFYALSDGSQIRTLIGHTDWVRSLAFSPDGKTLASGAFDATVRLWDVTTGQLLHALEDHQSSVLSLVFSPDGKTLASGSVDTTVKLWNVSSGEVLHTLVGHSGFVYSVAFSPDGNTLVSGADDNTLRVWDMTTDVFVAQEQRPIASDCRACHHPTGNNAPARVIQVRCDACHSSGAGINFCPIFPRSPQAVTEPLDFEKRNLPTGVPVGSNTLAVVINYPTNGETLYTIGQYRSFVLVTGQVYYQGLMDDVQVELSAFTADSEEPVLILLNNPSESGQFTFRLTLNPTEARPISIKLGGLGCADCHEDTRTQGGLPNGTTRLKVKAIADGGMAWDERYIAIDASGTANVQVKVLEEESGEPVPYLPVQASTMLYDWRARNAIRVSNAEGSVDFSLEALAQTSTLYHFSVSPSSMEEFSYESVNPVTLTLPAGATSHEPIIVRVRKKIIQMQGALKEMSANEQWDIWAIHLPDGAYYNSTVSPESRFSFEKIQSGEYILIAEEITPSSAGRLTAPVYVDTAQESDTSILLETKDTAVFTGRTLDKRNQPIPFAWIKASSAQPAWSDPVSGVFRLQSQERTRVPVEIWAPGYYSQAQVIDFTSSSVTPQDFIFEIQPETENLNWGGGRITIPAETYSEADSNGLALIKGWLWGSVAETKPLEVSMAGIKFQIKQGAFIMEYLPNDGGWLYLANGEVLAYLPDGIEKRISGGHLVTVFEGGMGEPIPYSPLALGVLRSSREPLIEPIWQPGLSARIRDSLANFGISLIQLITFITYLIVIVVLVGTLISGIYWLWKQREYKNHHNSGG